MRYLALLLGSLVALACTDLSVDPLESATQATLAASVQFLELEGGCWTLEVGEGVHYQPINLPDEFLHDGLLVSAELLRRDDFGSTCQVGPMVEVLSISRR